MPKTAISPAGEIIAQEKYMPCVSILMPFEPKMGLKKELNHKLKITADHLEKELKENFPPEKYQPVLEKLRHVIDHVNYLTHKKSIAIFISPLIEKVYYLDLPIEEHVYIDQSFEIRDLVYCKKETSRYLLVVLSNKWTKIYLGNSTHFIRITSNVPDHIDAFRNDIPEKIANFSDESKRKEILMEKFLRSTDNGLTLLLNAYKLPLFIMGTDRTLGHFKSVTKHARQVIRYISGNFEDKSEYELQEWMKPYLKDWKKIKQQKLLYEIEEAAGSKKLAVGISQVWRAASQKKGRLLIVEKNFIVPAHQGASGEVIYKMEEMQPHAFYIKDAVDDVIEKVLSSGGDVEFVEEGLLREMGRIVLIEYF